MALIIISTIIKMIRLAIILILISFYIGIIFFILADLTNDFPSVARHVDSDDVGENFIEYFGFNEMQFRPALIKSIYYASTSLTTVGFGDLHPRSNPERIIIAFTLLMGVTIFSYFMGTLIDIIN